MTAIIELTVPRNGAARLDRLFAPDASGRWVTTERVEYQSWRPVARTRRSTHAGIQVYAVLDGIYRSTQTSIVTPTHVVYWRVTGSRAVAVSRDQLLRTFGIPRLAHPQDRHQRESAANYRLLTGSVQPESAPGEPAS